MTPQKLAEIRVIEQKRAALKLGIKSVCLLNNQDGYLMPDLNLRRDVTRVIRKIRPDVVLTCDPTNLFHQENRINHPDHRAAGQVALDAVFRRRIIFSSSKNYSPGASRTGYNTRGLDFASESGHSGA
jgi:LmbE family N-acetylglucosaminyl deacetylase